MPPDARAILQANPRRAEVADLPAGAVRVTLKPDPRGYRPMIVLLLAVAILLAVARLLLGHWPLAAAHPALAWSFCIGCAILAAFLAVLSFTQGPPRPTILEARPGHLKIDHHPAGDHVVRDYAAADIHCLWSDGTSIVISTRTDKFTLGMFIAKDAQIAAIELLAPVVWGDAAFVARNHLLRGRNRVVPVFASGNADS